MDVEQKNRAYRRGLILGWTLAEIFVLILFILLLAFAASYVRDVEHALAEEKHAEKLAGENARLKATVVQQAEQIEKVARANAELQEQNVYLKSHLLLPNNFDDQLRELQLRQNQIDALKTQVTDLNERDSWMEGLEEAFGHETKMHGDPRTAIKEFLGCVGDTERALEIMRLSGLADAKETKVREPVERLLKALAKANIRGDNLDTLANRLASVGDCRNELQQKQGQMISLQRKLVALGGHGTEMPPCWVTPDGRIEYIFDITLTSSGLVVHDNLLPDHVEEEKRLFKRLVFDKTVTPDQFLAATADTYEEGRAQKCGFFVRVFDGTAPDEKAVYKQRLQTVEAHFYKLLADRRGSAGSFEPVEKAR